MWSLFQVLKIQMVVERSPKTWRCKSWEPSVSKKKKEGKKEKQILPIREKQNNNKETKKLQERQNQSSASSIKRINALANSATLKDLNNHWRSLSLVIFSGYWVMAELFPWQETPHSKSKTPKKLTVEKAAVSLSKSERKTNHKWKYGGFRITCKLLVTLKNTWEQEGQIRQKKSK